MLQLLVTALGNDDGFGEAVLRATAIRVDEELDKAEASLKRGSAIAKSAFDTMPEAEMPVHDGDDANLHEALAGSAALPFPQQDAEIEDGDEEVDDVVDELLQLGFFRAFGNHEPRTDHDIDIVLAGLVVGGCGYIFRQSRLAFELADSNPACEAEPEDEGHQNADDDPINPEGECTTPEAGKLDAVELLEPLGFAGRKIAHGKSVAGVPFWAERYGSLVHLAMIRTCPLLEFQHG